jgi:outer membrane lipoprotein SlyB
VTDVQTLVPAADGSDCREDNIMKRLLIPIVAGLSVLLIACEPADGERSATNSEYGMVESVVLIERGVDNTTAGTVAGAIIGGVVGHQVGSGRGNTAATVAGAAGGAYVGQQIAKDQRRPDLYEVTVKMESGGYQTVVVDDASYAVGEPVRVVNGDIYRR